MYISGADDALSCKIFVGTLKGATHKWIAGHFARSVTSFEDLATSSVILFDFVFYFPYIQKKKKLQL